MAIRSFADTLALFRRYPWLFLALAAIVLVPYELLALAVTGAAPGARGSANPVADAVLTLLDFALVGPLISALHAHAVVDARAGAAPELRPVFARGVGVLPGVALASIIAWLGIGLGLLLLVVPGVYFFVRWLLVAQAAAIDRHGWRRALHQSFALTEGRFWGVLGFALLLGAVMVGPLLLVRAPLAGLPTLVAFGLTLPVNVLLASFYALALAVLYVDLREQLPQATGDVPAGPPPATTVPAPAPGTDPGWDPRRYSDGERPQGWYVDPAAPHLMRYWGAGGKPSWTSKTNTPRKIRGLWADP